MAVISGALTFVRSQFDLTAAHEGHPQHFGSLPFFASWPFGSSIRLVPETKGKSLEEIQEM